LFRETEGEGGPVLPGRERAVAGLELGSRLDQLRDLEPRVAGSAEAIDHPIDSGAGALLQFERVVRQRRLRGGACRRHRQQEGKEGYGSPEPRSPPRGTGPIAGASRHGVQYRQFTARCASSATIAWYS